MDYYFSLSGWTQVRSAPRVNLGGTMKHLLLAGSMLALVLIRPTTAAVIVENFPGSSEDGTALGGVTVSDRVFGAFGLSVGGTALQFVSLETIFSNSNTSSSRVVSGGVYSDSGGNPGSLLASFNLVTIPSQALTVTITSTTFVLLEANTSYWFALTGPVATGVLPNWQKGTAAPIATGFATPLGYRTSTNDAATWSVSTINNQLRVNANPDFAISDVPEPSTLVLSATGLLLAGYFVRRRA